MTRLTHLDDQGKASMVDVSDKDATTRTAEAEGFVRMQPATAALIRENGLKKGDVLAAARIAGIMAAKRTSDLIPLCHPLALSKVSVDFDWKTDECLRIRAFCKLKGQTGVEMEALTAVSVAALTVYDMCKAVDRGICIDNIRLTSKEGGKSGAWKRHD